MSMLVPVMTLCNILLFILGTIRKRKLNMDNILLYHELYCINQVAVSPISVVTGELMSFGLVIFVFGNWMVVSVWDLVSVEIYLINVGVVVIAYFVLFQTIHMAIQVNEVSIEIIREWKIKSRMCFRGGLYLKKMIPSLRPVAFYYGLTKFEKDTKVNYYSNIVDNTINVLMLF